VKESSRSLFQGTSFANSVEALRKKKNLKGSCSVRDSNRIPPDHKVRRVAPSCSVHSLSVDTKQRERINKADYEYDI
jgi:hypothetical protein